MNTKADFRMPNRFHLSGVYSAIHRGMVKLGTPPKTLINEKRQLVELTAAQEAVIKKALSGYTFEEQVFLRILNDQNRYYLGDELLYTALILNEVLPRVRDLESAGREVADIDKFPDGKVITSEELVFDHLRNESPVYLRKLLGAALDAKKYYLPMTKLSEKTVDVLEAQTASWVIGEGKPNQELLQILSMIGQDGRPSELRDLKDPVVRFISEMFTGVLPLSEFKRSDDTYFSRFVNLLPSLIFWVVGQNVDADEPLSPESEDCLMDLGEIVKLFTRSLQDHADQAGRIRQYMHYGFPVYKEAMKLASNQYNLMSWNFESILHILSYLIHDLTRDRRNSAELLRFFGASGILFLYAKHKNAFVKRS